MPRGNIQYCQELLPERWYPPRTTYVLHVRLRKNKWQHDAGRSVSPYLLNNNATKTKLERESLPETPPPPSHAQPQDRIRRSKRNGPWVAGTWRENTKKEEPKKRGAIGGPAKDTRYTAHTPTSNHTHSTISQKSRTCLPTRHRRSTVVYRKHHKFIISKAQINHNEVSWRNKNRARWQKTTSHDNYRSTNFSLLLLLFSSSSCEIWPPITRHNEKSHSPLF